MKKILTGLLVVTLAVSAGSVTVSAAETVYGRNYADANKDGICDYCGQEDGCNLKICNGNGRYFIDKDGDGVCDNYKNNSCHGKYKSSGKCGKYRGYRRGHCGR